MNAEEKRTAKQRKLAAQLGEIGFALPGSLTVKAYKCGKQNCRCKADPPKLHGPYAFWTRKVNAKTVTRMLNKDEVAAYQPMFDNSRKIRDLVAALQELSLELIEPAAPRRSPKATKASSGKASSPRGGKATRGQG